MDERQHTWLQNFLGIPIPPPPGSDAAPGTGPMSFTGDSDQERAPAGAGPVANKTPPPSSPRNEKATAAVAFTRFVNRYKAIGNPDQTFETIEAKKAYAAAFNPFVDAWNAKDYAKAVTLIGPAEAALNALQAAVADIPSKESAAKAEATRIKRLGEAELRKLPPADRASLLRKLLGGGQPGADVRAAQIRLYNTAQIDPDFTKEDNKRGQAIADELKGDPALKKARDGWANCPPQDKVKTLQRIVAVQSKHLGIPPPGLMIDPSLSTKPSTPGKTLTVHGKFVEKDGKLHLNMGPDSNINDFEKAIALVLHETAHRYQIELVARLQDNRLKPGDPEYAEAQMIAINRLVPGGYIPDDESFSDYEKQPIEAQSNATSKPLAHKIVAGLGK